MAKNVFRAKEVKNTFRKVYIQPPEEFAPQLDTAEVDEISDYAGPTADDLRREAEAFQANWDQEREGMIQKARDEADRIVKDAERVAFDEVKKKQEQAQQIKTEAGEDAARQRPSARLVARQARLKRLPDVPDSTRGERPDS